MTVRIGTYNVRGMQDDVPALVRVVTAMRPDVLCVQEAPRFFCWRSKRMQLADATGLSVASGRRLGGVAVYVGPHVSVIHAESHVLKIFPPKEIRGLAIAVVEADGHRVAVGSIHLDLVESMRLYHANEAVALVEAAAARFGAIPVVAGDINEQSHQETWRFIAGKLVDSYPCAPRGDGLTFTANNPRERIDGIFVGAGLSVVACGGVDAAPLDLARATDHLPVVAELAFG